MEYLFRPHGIMYRPVKLEKNWYKSASGAMLGKLKTGEAVALLPDKLGLYGFFDPTTQKRVRLGRKTQELLEEDAYCFYKPFPLRKIGIRDLMLYISGSTSLSTNDVGNHYSPTVIVAAVTSRFFKKRALPTHVPLDNEELEKNSLALLEQIRTIDKSRLIRKIGRVPKETMEEIDRAIFVSLALGHLVDDEVSQTQR